MANPLNPIQSLEQSIARYQLTSDAQVGTITLANQIIATTYSSKEKIDTATELLKTSQRVQEIVIKILEKLNKDLDVERQIALAPAAAQVLEAPQARVGQSSCNQKLKNGAYSIYKTAAWVLTPVTTMISFTGETLKNYFMPVDPAIEIQRQQAEVQTKLTHEYEQLLTEIDSKNRKLTAEQDNETKKSDLIKKFGVVAYRAAERLNPLVENANVTEGYLDVCTGKPRSLKLNLAVRIPIQAGIPIDVKRGAYNGRVAATLQVLNNSFFIEQLPLTIKARLEQNNFFGEKGPARCWLAHHHKLSIEAQTALSDVCNVFQQKEIKIIDLENLRTALKTLKREGLDKLDLPTEHIKNIHEILVLLDCYFFIHQKNALEDNLRDLYSSLQKIIPGASANIEDCDSSLITFEMAKLIGNYNNQDKVEVCIDGQTPKGNKETKVIIYLESAKKIDTTCNWVGNIRKNYRITGIQDKDKGSAYVCEHGFLRNKWYHCENTFRVNESHTRTFQEYEDDQTSVHKAIVVMERK